MKALLPTRARRPNSGSYDKWRRLRRVEAFVEQDGICADCRCEMDIRKEPIGAPPPGNMATLDHKVPIVLGGAARSRKNTEAVCANCNRRRNKAMQKARAQMIDEAVRRYVADNPSLHRQHIRYLAQAAPGVLLPSRYICKHVASHFENVVREQAP